MPSYKYKFISLLKWEWIGITWTCKWFFVDLKQKGILSSGDRDLLKCCTGHVIM
jgi:hypothetical protein